jgi:5-oxoprolinase (ATP-hydrolysing)
MKKTAKESTQTGWQFRIDRGGTFTDVVAIDPNGRLVTHKLLSENPGRYTDAPLQGIRDILAIKTDEPIPAGSIDAVKMVTTVGTNALLEHKGEPTALVITRGFKDALRIAYQHRPDIFAMHIELPEPLYSHVIEVDERIDARGNIIAPLDISGSRRARPVTAGSAHICPTSLSSARVSTRIRQNYCFTSHPADTTPMWVVLLPDQCRRSVPA